MESSSSSSAASKTLHLVRASNNLYRVLLHGKRRSSVQVQLYGAQVLSWKNHRGEELLFVSEDDVSPSTPEGIEICFPVVPDHGCRDLQELARYRMWSIEEHPPPLPTCSLTKSSVDLILRPHEGDLKVWPHRFEYRLRVALGYSGDLTLISRIRNVETTRTSFSFTFAHRNYLRVSHINEVCVEGLGTLMYHIDKLKDNAKVLTQADRTTFESEVDKVFLSTPSKICAIDQQKKQAVIMRKEGLPDRETSFQISKRLLNEMCSRADYGFFGKDEYKNMVCIEPRAVEQAITLRPAEEWRVMQELSFVPSTCITN